MKQSFCFFCAAGDAEISKSAAISISRGITQRAFLGLNLIGTMAILPPYVLTEHEDGKRIFM